MKRMLAVFLALLLTVVCLCAAAESNLATSSMGGVEGESVPCTYKAFTTRFSNCLLILELSCEFLKPVYSDGSWAYAGMFEDVSVKVKTSSQKQDARVNAIYVVGYEETASEVLTAAALAMIAAADCGDAGIKALDALATDANPQGYFAKEPLCYWFENGFRLMLGVAGEFRYASVEYAQPQAVKGGYAVPDASLDFVGIRKGMKLEELTEKLSAYGAYFSMPEIQFEAAEKAPDGSYYSLADWAGNDVLAISPKAGKPVEAILVFNNTGDTNYAWAASFSAFAVMAGLEEDEALALCYLNEGEGRWEDLCAMAPYAAVNDVMLQCVLRDGQPVGIICGMEDAK